MARIFGLVIAVIFCCCGMISTADPKNTTCDSVFEQASGRVSYFKKRSSVDPDIKCSWTIKFQQNTTNVTHDEIFLVMTEFRLLDKDSLKISDNTTGLMKPLNLGPFSGQHAPFTVLTGVTNIVVELDTKDKTTFTRKFEMWYYTTLGCFHNLTSLTTGTIQSPIYDQSRTVPFNCMFSFAARVKDGFKLATIVTPLQPPLPNLQLYVRGSELDKNYTGLYSSVEYTSTDILYLNVSVQPHDKLLQQVQIAYEAVTKECSGTKELKKGNPVKFTNPASTESSVKETPSLNCRQIVVTDGSVVALTVTVNAHSLPGSLDQLQVLNGMDRQAESILQLTSTNQKDWEDQYIMTNRQNLSISLLSSFPSPKLNVTITVGTADYGGYFEDNGTLSLSNQASGPDPAIFLLKVDPKKQVKLDLGNSYKEGNLKFFYNFEKNATPFAELSSNRKASSFISPSPLMMIKASNFGKEIFNATFYSVDRGCFSTGTDEVGSYNLFGKCVPLCTWTIAPKVNAIDKEKRKVHFSSLLLNPDDNLLMVQPDQTILANVTGPLHSMPDFDLLAKEGLNVIVSRNCSRNETKTAIVADYAPIPKCERNVTLETGKSLILSSPGYPNSYPVNSNCLWKIQVKANDLIHVSFESLRLGGSDHTLQLISNLPKDDKLLVKFTGPTCPNDTLPRDYIVSANLTVDFSGGTYNRTIEGSVYGFQINLTAADCGGELMQDSGNFSTPTPPKGNTTDAKLCYWLVGVSNKTKSIVLYNSSASTTTPNGYLEVHEGCSIRDQMSLNLTGTNLLSRLDRILFVYKNPKSTAGPVVSVAFAATPCNLTTCGNGVCMHAAWMCDGKNDCGDWSDERYCNGTCPSPSPPGPTPPQPPTTPAGVSNTALALAILAALLIGTLLGFAAPAAYRRIRTGQFGSYSSFTNNVDT